jgi:hypothetical protein
MISGSPLMQQPEMPQISEPFQAPFQANESRAEVVESAPEGQVVDVKEEQPKNDLEMPAFLRRERRLFQ